jgi:hypothetical protein
VSTANYCRREMLARHPDETECDLAAQSDEFMPPQQVVLRFYNSGGVEKNWRIWNRGNIGKLTHPDRYVVHHQKSRQGRSDESVWCARLRTNWTSN